MRRRHDGRRPLKGHGKDGLWGAFIMEFKSASGGGFALSFFSWAFYGRQAGYIQDSGHQLSQANKGMYDCECRGKLRHGLM